MKVWCKKISKITKGLDIEKTMIGFLVLVTLISGGILVSTRVKAGTEVVDEINVVIPTACSMSSGVSNDNVYSIGSVASGSYTPDIGTTRLKVFCNDFAGFSVYAVGFTNDIVGNNTMATSTTPAQTISTGTATSGNTSNWAMKLTKVTNTSGQADITYGEDNLAITDGTNSYDGVYRAVPSNYTKVATYTNNNGPATTDTILGSNIDARYAVFVSATQPAGTYEGKVKYMLVHPATMEAGTYTLAYNANGGTGTMESDTNLPNYQEHQIKANTFTAPTGYMFAGWCTVQDTTASGVVQGADPQTTCTGDSYPNNGTLPASPSTAATAGGTLTLYAYWKVPILYNEVAAMSKGTQTPGQLQAAITVPTSADRTEDTSNSGVYEYDSSEFGTASDASNTSKIYYYRGVLENSVGSYGSDGSAVTYPNYVVLSSASNKSGLTNKDTCWRIVRTTGPGGVKMIYNGKWTGTTCANAQANAQVTTQAFGLKGNSAQSTWYYNINRVGYTFNNTQSLQDSTTATPVDTVFGSDTDPSINNERSNIKKYIEDTWYTSNNDGISNYTSILEPSAGYCNDRTAYSDVSTSTALTTIPPYRTASSGQTMYFGAYGRNMNSAKVPSLTCPRSTVDLYHYVPNSTGVSNELKYPVALITADEASFAGSGSSTATNGSAYNANSYLRSGNLFWLLSPNLRDSSGSAVGFRLNSNGFLNYRDVGNANGVRPAISLKPGTTAASGTGIATDPWVVNAP